MKNNAIITNRIQEMRNLMIMSHDIMVISTLLEMNVFNFLSKGKQTSASISSELKLDESVLHSWLLMAHAMNYLNFDGIYFSLIPGEEELFKDNSPWESIIKGPEDGRLLEQCAQGKEILKNGQKFTVPGNGGNVSETSRRNFLKYLHNNSIEAAKETAKILAMENYTRIADLGCGAGTYSAALLRENPEAFSLLIDRENARNLVEEITEADGVQNRCEFSSIDFLHENIGENFDLILLSNVIHCYSSRDTLKILKKLNSSLISGGRIIIKELDVNRDFSSPLSALRFGVKMSMYTDGGKVYPPEEVTELFKEAGFTSEHVFALRKAPGAYLNIGRKK